MYYSNGNYEAFARPEKPADVERKSAYLVGAGLASLAAACFLVRDGQMKGEHIHILEDGNLPGGACDGIKDNERGFIIRGGREMENHFECLWDLFRSIPSLETEGASVLDEYYWLNKKDPNFDSYHYINGNMTFEELRHYAPSDMFLEYCKDRLYPINVVVDGE